MAEVREEQMRLDEPHPSYPAEGRCSFCGQRAEAHHEGELEEWNADQTYHDLAHAVRFDGDRPSRNDGSLLNYAVAVADSYAERYGLPRFDSVAYVPEGRC